jgi:uncharacterized membrane protein YphA (DoxX/SURF4 family)
MTFTIRNLAAWAAQILAALILLGAAAGKMVSSPGWVTRFRNWGYPDGFYLVIGVVEIIGAIALLVPRFAGRAAAAMQVVMISAFLTHLLHGEGAAVVRPLIVIVLLAAVIALRGFSPAWRGATGPARA